MQLSLAALSALIAAAAAVKVKLQIQQPDSEFDQQFVEILDGTLTVGQGGGEFVPDFENGQLMLGDQYVVASNDDKETLYLSDSSTGEFTEVDEYLSYGGDFDFSAQLFPPQEHKQGATILASTGSLYAETISLKLVKVDDNANPSAPASSPIHPNSTIPASSPIRSNPTAPASSPIRSNPTAPASSPVHQNASAPASSPVHSNPTGPVTTTVHHNSTVAATSTAVKTITSCGDQGCHVLTQTSPAAGHATSANGGANGHASGASTVVKTITSCGNQGCHTVTTTVCPASGQATSAAGHASSAAGHASAASGHPSGAQTVVKTITSCGDQGCHVVTKSGAASSHATSAAGHASSAAGHASSAAGHASSAAGHASAASGHPSAASGHASGTGAQQVSASHSTGVIQVNGAAKVGGAAAAVFGAIAAALI